LDYRADIANFLEPWYGIGIAASSFGAEYKWEEENAPAIAAPFKSVREVLQREVVPIEETAIGRHTLEMIEYFLDRTAGRIPISPTDTQSSLNAASFLIDTNSFYTELIDKPDEMKKLLSILTDLSIGFTEVQKKLIGDALVLPGHGFASSRSFAGLGMSSDVMVTVSGDIYREFDVPCLEKAGRCSGGVVFHSCGNWSDKISQVKKAADLVMIDGAFSAETDPDPNPVEPFADAFAGSGVIVNARIVGDRRTVADTVRRFRRPGMKLIAVTYCRSPEEQEAVYSELHDLSF
jgi:uroporphyrinogen-III decarboxylase